MTEEEKREREVEKKAERKRGERIERMAHRVARSVCLTHYGYAKKQDHKYLEAFSLAQLAVCKLLAKYPRIRNTNLSELARKRVVNKLAYKGEVINKTKHFVKKEAKASLESGEVDPERPRDHYLQQEQIPDSDNDENGVYEYFETEQEYDLDPLATCNGDSTNREIIHRLTETQQTCNQIANALGIKNYKERSADIKQNIKSRDPMSSRKPRTEDPKILRKVQPLAHDNCSPQSGCPVTRMKAFCCETALDELLVDLYRDGHSIESITVQVDQQADWIKTRLAIIAHRYLEM